MPVLSDTFIERCDRREPAADPAVDPSLEGAPARPLPVHCHRPSDRPSLSKAAQRLRAQGQRRPEGEMITMFDLRTRFAVRLRDELTASHTVLRHDAAMCLRALAAISDGENADVDRDVKRFHTFLRLTSRYCDGRRTLLWPVIAQLFPSAHAELMRLTKHSLALKSDVAIVNSALNELLAVYRCSPGDRAAITLAALGAIRPAKILHDALSLHLGDEELVLRDLLGELSLQQIVDARKVLAL
jgi:hypothetical protein